LQQPLGPLDGLIMIDALLKLFRGALALHVNPPAADAEIAALISLDFGWFAGHNVNILVGFEKFILTQNRQLFCCQTVNNTP